MEAVPTRGEFEEPAAPPPAWYKPNAPLRGPLAPPLPSLRPTRRVWCGGDRSACPNCSDCTLNVQ